MNSFFSDRRRMMTTFPSALDLPGGNGVAESVVDSKSNGSVNFSSYAICAFTMKSDTRPPFFNSDGSIAIHAGEILDAGVNHSPSAHLNNPAEERSKYKYDVDKEMTIWRLDKDRYHTR